MQYHQDTYCPAPWHGGFYTYNQQSVCCTLDGVPTNSIVNFYKSDYVGHLKKNLIAGTPPADCQRKCFDLEKLGTKSHREIYIDAYKNKGIEFDRDPNSASTVQYIEIRLSNLCNFKCRMCTPQWSSMIGKELEQAPELAKWYFAQSLTHLGHHEYTVEFLDEIVEMIPNLKWINFTGGEPMLIPEVGTMIDKISSEGSKNISLHFTTNASVLNPKIVNRLQDFAHIQLTLSIDGIGSVGEYIRHGTVWDRVVKNCDDYGKLKLKNHNIGINYNISLSAYAALSIDRTMEYICAYNKKYQCYSTDMCIVTGTLSPLNLYGLSKQRAIDSLTKALVIIEEYCYSGAVGSDRMAIVGNQLTVLKNQMIESPGDVDSYTAFKQCTQDFDQARNESFKQVFGFELD